MNEIMGHSSIPAWTDPYPLHNQEPSDGFNVCEKIEYCDRVIPSSVELIEVKRQETGEEEDRIGLQWPHFHWPQLWGWPLQWDLNSFRWGLIYLRRAYKFSSRFPSVWWFTHGSRRVRLEKCTWYKQWIKPILAFAFLAERCGVWSELRGVCLKSILATIHSTSEEHGDRRRSFLRAKNNKEHSIYKSMTGGRYQ